MAKYGTELPKYRVRPERQRRGAGAIVSQRRLKYRVAGPARGERLFVPFPLSHPWCVRCQPAYFLQ